MPDLGIAVPEDDRDHAVVGDNPAGLGEGLRIMYRSAPGCGDPRVALGLLDDGLLGLFLDASRVRRETEPGSVDESARLSQT